MVKTLPKGLFVIFNDLPHDTEDQDIQDIIAARTGVVIPLDRIETKKIAYSYVRAMVSFESQHIADILSWALTDDRVQDKPLVAQLMGSLKRDAA
jgi:hypothetical protein